ncbi:hypothetical protein U1Q18_045261, partial [Sarracenia purpurea var. burkii]
NGAVGYTDKDPVCADNVAEKAKIVDDNVDVSEVDCAMEDDDVNCEDMVDGTGPEEKNSTSLQLLDRKSIKSLGGEEKVATDKPGPAVSDIHIGHLE